MKKIFSTTVKILNFLVSAFLFKVSGGRIKTKMAKEYRKIAREKNQKRIDDMQAALDEEHARLRGWTKATYRTEQVKPDPRRDQLLEAEIKRAHEAMGLLA